MDAYKRCVSLCVVLINVHCTSLCVGVCTKHQLTFALPKDFVGNVVLCDIMVMIKDLKVLLLLTLVA